MSPLIPRRLGPPLRTPFVDPCCLRALSTVSATGYRTCNEATYAFTVRCNLMLRAHSFRACCRRAPPSCFRATAPPLLRSLSLLASVGLSPTSQRALCLDTPIPQRLAYLASRLLAFTSLRLVQRHQGAFMSLACTQTTAPTG